MAHSHAERPTLACPDCGQRFTPEIWLIIDAAERPDLLARARGGAIHRVVCPNGHAGEVDAPLLIYRPGEARPLLFSPARRTTAEQDREMAAGLLQRLAGSLGGGWRDEWLEGVAAIPRGALPAVLDGADPQAAAAEELAGAIPPGVQAALAEIAAALAEEGVVLQSEADLARALDERPALRARLEAAVRAAAEEVDDSPGGGAGEAGDRAAASQLDPLLAALQVFVQAETWFASYQYVTAHPELLTDEADAALVRLIGNTMMAGREITGTVYTECLILLRRAREIGVVPAFAEKLGITLEQLQAADAAGLPEQVQRQEAVAEVENGVSTPPKYYADVQRADWAKTRYQNFGDLPALDEAISAWQRVLNHAGFSETPKRFQLASKNAAAVVLRLRFQALAKLSDLAQALEYWTDIVRHPPLSLTTYAGYLNNLTTCWLELYSLSGQPTVLDKAIDTLRGCLERTGTDSPIHALLLNNLADYLWRRYADFRRPDDLDEAILRWEAARVQMAVEPLFQAEVLNGLATGLQERFVMRLQLPDLEDAICYYYEAIRLTSARAVDRASRLINLSGALLAHYLHTGQTEDIVKALRLAKYARRHALPNSIQYIQVLNNLANALLIFSRWSQRPSDMDFAATVAGEACRLSRSIDGEAALHAPLTSSLLGALPGKLVVIASETTLYASHTWADVSLRRGDWESVLEAVNLGGNIIEQLNKVNILSTEQLSWRRKVQGLASAEAYAHARLEGPTAAALSLETGQARGLNAALGRGRDRELLERLRGEDEALFAAYEATAAAAGAAQRAGQGAGLGPGDGSGAPPDFAARGNGPPRPWPRSMSWSTASAPDRATRPSSPRRRSKTWPPP